MSGIVVTKSSPVLIVPSSVSSPPAGGDTDTITISSFDKWVGSVPVTALLAYDRPIHEPAETVKKALARALEHYRPLAGRLIAGADGESCLSCTDEGVMFVAASASSSMDLEAVATSAALLKDLALYYPAGNHLCRDADPLLLVQVTEFSSGGFVVGVTWNHVAADGVGMAQFLQAVGELARGASTPSVVPVRCWDESLAGLLPASMVSMQRSTMSTLDVDHLNVTVPGSLVRRIKAETGATVVEAVMAVLWRCRTCAVMSPSSSQGDNDPELPAPLAFVCNMRMHAGARDGYYGNCITSQMVPATKRAVAASSIGDLVRLIRRAKEKAPNVLSGSGVAREQPQPQSQPQVVWYNALLVVSWHNLGFDTIDLGTSGGPARVMGRFPERNVVPACKLCPPCTPDGGVRVSSMFVKPEHVDAFLGELASLATST